MTEDRFWELVNREIDQELSDADRAELDDISGQNPEWADRRTQMIRASELLAEVEAVEAPADLRSNIAQAIDGRTPHPQKVTPPPPSRP